MAVGAGHRRASGKARPGATEASLPAIPAQLILTQTDRILNSEKFRYSERLCRFLRFVVEQQLSGNAEQIKESVLAVEIFDREPAYNSRLDSIVRVEARRLREKLDKYYGEEGREDPVIVALPKGSYVPAFRLRTADERKAASPEAGPRQVSLKVVAAIALGLVLSTLALVRWFGGFGAPPAPPLRRLTSDSGVNFEPALSPDGRLLAYSSDRNAQGDLDIWLRQMGGGLPLRLSDNPRDDIEASFSPDGTRLAYRAEGADAGIYLVPALGGPRTLLVRGGYRPRFSPDGNRIAYWTGERMFRAARAFVVPVNGGMPVQIQPGFQYAAYPVWAPEGRHVLFIGSKESRPIDWDPLADWDWWVAPVDGGSATRTAARRVLTEHGLRPPDTPWSHRRIVPTQWTASGHLIFAAVRNGQTNLWRLRLSSRTWQVTEPPEQLTFGAGREDHPTMASDGTLAFSVLTRKSDVWSLPVDPNTGEVRGPLARLTSDPASHLQPVVSQDGSRLAFISNRNGNHDLWVKHLGTGHETALTASQQDESSLAVTPDGERVAFGYSRPRSRTMFAAPFAGGAIEQLCADCGEPRSWLPRSGGLVYQRIAARESLVAVLLPSGRSFPLVQSSESALFSPSVSRDGRWVALIVRTPPDEHRIVVVPYREGLLVPRPDWITAAGPGAWFDKPRWSPNGRLIYYLSDRDGSVCIWAQPFDPAKGKPVGDPKAVAHFHARRSSLGGVDGPELSVADDKLVFNLSEDSGNLWLAPAGK